MKTALPIAIALLAACRSTGSPAVDEAARKDLFATVSALEGTWQRSDSTGEVSTTEFKVSSGGTAVIETMFPGTPHEMTNVYTLDGDGLVMTHYCAGGNQPSMRATAKDGNALPFRFESVRDLDAPDQTYMGEMTLVFHEDGTVEQCWVGLTGGKPDPAHAMAFTLKR